MPPRPLARTSAFRPPTWTGKLTNGHTIRDAVRARLRAGDTARTSPAPCPPSRPAPRGRPVQRQLECRARRARSQVRRQNAASVANPSARSPVQPFSRRHNCSPSKMSPCSSPGRSGRPSSGTVRSRQPWVCSSLHRPGAICRMRPPEAARHRRERGELARRLAGEIPGQRPTDRESGDQHPLAIQVESRHCVGQHLADKRQLVAQGRPHPERPAPPGPPGPGQPGGRQQHVAARHDRSRQLRIANDRRA